MIRLIHMATIRRSSIREHGPCHRNVPDFDSPTHTLQPTARFSFIRACDLSSAKTGPIHSGFTRPQPPKLRGIAGFFGLPRGLPGKSLQPQTQWRWRESRANWSLGADPCLAGKVQGSSPQFDSAGGTRAEFPERFHGSRYGFPVIENRESIPTSREVVGSECAIVAIPVQPRAKPHFGARRLGDARPRSSSA